MGYGMVLIRLKSFQLASLYPCHSGREGGGRLVLFP